MSKADRYNLPRVLKPCNPWQDDLCQAEHVVYCGEYRVEQFSHGGLQAYKVSGPTGVVWFEVDPHDVMTAVLGIGTSIVSGEKAAGNIGRRRSIENRLGVSLEEYERRVANGTKSCSICREWLPFADYSLNRGRPLGLAVTCKECMRVAHNARRADQGKPQHKKSRARGRIFNRRDAPMAHAPTAESVVVDNFAPGVRELLGTRGATLMPHGARWYISLPAKVRFIKTSRDCGIFRFENGSAMLVDRIGGKLLATVINQKGEG